MPKIYLKNNLKFMIYTAVRFSITFFCYILELCIENIKKNWDKTVLRIWSQIFVFYADLKDETKKSYWKPNSSVFTVCLQFFLDLWAFLLLWGLISNIFTIFFRGSAIRLARCDSYGYFFSSQNSKHFYSNL